MIDRRRFLQLGGAALTLAATPLRRAAAQNGGGARRFIVFYFPDGVPGVSAEGEPSLWHCTGGERDFLLSEVLQPLAPWRDHCVFLNGLSMGGTDSGSHPGGAVKLLTGVDHGNGESIDRVLARTLGADAPFRHLYLGAQANQNNASGDKHISYPSAGRTTPPEDDPVRAFETVFSGAVARPVPGGGGGAMVDPAIERKRSIIDGVLGDLNALRARLGDTERARLDLHLEAMREVERRVQSVAVPPEEAPPVVDDCAQPAVDTARIDRGRLYDPGHFPDLLRVQTDLCVQAMACGLTQVGVIQGSHHTSELVMSRFEGSALHDPGYDMRSHQASHYGPRHDRNHREFSDFVKQRVWWVEQFAYLLGQLAARPEGDGTMLHHTCVLLCTEVSDGNTHLHDNMPFVVAGGAGGRINGGRLLNFGYERHARMLLSLAHACGVGLDRFGSDGHEPLPGLVG